MKFKYAWYTALVFRFNWQYQRFNTGTIYTRRHTRSTQPGPTYAIIPHFFHGMTSEICNVKCCIFTCIYQKETRFFVNILLLVVINKKFYLISTILLKGHSELCLRLSKYDIHTTKHILLRFQGTYPMPGNFVNGQTQTNICF